MQAIDTNVLVFAAVTRSPHHRQAKELLAQFAEGSIAWAIPWPCIYEFLRIVTHPRVYHPPMSVDVALEHLRKLFAAPSLVLLAETPRHPEVLNQVIRDSAAVANLVHDAHIAALCLEHGVSELITGDRDFLRFRQLRVVDPFATPAN